MQFVVEFHVETINRFQNFSLAYNLQLCKKVIRILKHVTENWLKQWILTIPEFWGSDLEDSPRLLTTGGVSSWDNCSEKLSPVKNFVQSFVLPMYTV